MRQARILQQPADGTRDLFLVVFVDQLNIGPQNRKLLFEELRREGEEVWIVPELDYKDGLQQTGFSIDNPNAQRTCGCGQSFTPEESDAQPEGEAKH